MTDAITCSVCGGPIAPEVAATIRAARASKPGNVIEQVICSARCRDEFEAVEAARRRWEVTP